MRSGGKILIDVTNALNQDFQLALGFTTCGAEELQKRIADTKVVKCFNTAFAPCMSTGAVKGQQASVFVAGDDDEARSTVCGTAGDIGFKLVY